MFQFINDSEESPLFKKNKLFFRDLIVLARETLFCFENNVSNPLIYEIYSNGNTSKWFQFTYDMKIKKWLYQSYSDETTIIFNPKISEIKLFLEKFKYSDILLSHDRIEEIYQQYNYLKS